MNLAEKNMSNYIDLSGQKFGRLTVIERLFERRNHDYRSALWLCRCDCGNEVRTYAGYLKSGNTKSCGCLHKEAVTKHGFRHLPEYNIWRGMLDRCYNKETAAYPRYGGRGITVSDEWKESFEAFYRDMGTRPSEDYSIDRKDNDKGYSKENCRWATEIEQHNNTRTVKLYDFGGEKLSISQIARKIGISVSALHQRLLIMPWEEAVGYDTITFEGETKSLVDWCGILDLSYREVYRRLRKGDKFENIVSE